MTEEDSGSMHPNEQQRHGLEFGLRELGKGKGLLILGLPGTGKSTLARFIAQQLESDSSSSRTLEYRAKDLVAAVKANSDLSALGITPNTTVIIVGLDEIGDLPSASSIVAVIAATLSSNGRFIGVSRRAPEWLRPEQQIAFITLGDTYSETTEIQEPAIVIAWDPEKIEPDEYALLVRAIGDLIRSEGAVGLERIGSQGVFLPAEEVMPV